MPRVVDRFKKGWNAFLGRDPTYHHEFGYISSSRPDRLTMSFNNTRSIVNSIYNRIAVDVSQIDIMRVRVDKDGNYVETIESELNDVLTMDANVDQTGRELIKDAVMSMFDEGCVAIVPTETDTDPDETSSFVIYSLRVGKIVDWYPTSVRLSVYNERTGMKEEIEMDKANVAIVENPFYSMMNEQNSTLQRLKRVLNQLDKTNENNSAGKLDLIIQLPYSIRSVARKAQAKMRRTELEKQLSNSQHGIGYIDSTEKVVQLNRSVDNNLWTQSKELLTDFYNQLGWTQGILDGTADEKTLLNYYNRTINPILCALTEEMTRKWLSKTARTQGQLITHFQDPFRLIPATQLAELSDKLKRNEIMTSNEIRSKIGIKPFNDPKADELRNSNINQMNQQTEEEKNS